MVEEDGKKGIPVKRELERDLDRFEAKLTELRILYEQHFVDVLAQPPSKQHDEIRRDIRELLRAPFKNSQGRFRLKSLIHRYQTYDTYWQRVLKQKEQGNYSRDLFKAEIRERTQKEITRATTNTGAAEKSIKELYQSFETAVRRTGGNAEHLSFEAFKKSLLARTKALKEQHGAKALKYSVVVKDGKVVLKATPK